MIFVFIMSNDGKHVPESNDSWMRRNRVKGQRRVKAPKLPTRPSDPGYRPYRDGESKVPKNRSYIGKVGKGLREAGHTLARAFSGSNRSSRPAERGRTKYRAPHPPPRDWSPSPPPPRRASSSRGRASSPPPRKTSSPPPRESQDPPPTKDDDDSAYVSDHDETFGWLKESNIVLRM